MCLAQGPQRGDAGEARTRGLESGTLPLSHCAPLFSMDVKQEINLKHLYLPNLTHFLLLPYLMP